MSSINVTLFRLINDTFRCRLLDTVLPIFSDKDYVVVPGIVALLATLILGGKTARACVLALVLALGCSDFGSEHIWKNLFAQPRPYQSVEHVWVYRAHQWLIYDPVFDSRQSNGFPSSHAANIAAVACVLALFYRRSLWATVPVALLVGWSRVYTGNHFPGDILAAYVWGIACGALFALACRRIFTGGPGAISGTDHKTVQQPSATSSAKNSISVK